MRFAALSAAARANTDVWTISGQFFAEHQATPGFHPSYRHEEPAKPNHLHCAAWDALALEYGEL
jgi:hypothetical protein